MRQVMMAMLLLAMLALPCMADDEELVVTPGWTDATFDGSDHQTSGIDVYVNPDFGNIPEVPPPWIW